MKYYLSLFFVLSLTMMYPAQASNGYYPPGQSIENPAKTIHDALKKLQAFGANRDNAKPELLRNFLETKIIPHFAFDRMTDWVAGPYARRMSAANMRELEANVKQAFLDSLSKHLGDYDTSGARVTIKPVQYRGSGQAQVTALIYSARPYPDRLDFRMQTQGNGWKIVDVTANGNSAALYYRRHFISTLRQY
ncbi:MAG: ABC transporter substrate-binding protein [Gammaproteobacteria bacterium]|nr:ABC transporter substrate-binding protein [Gammaproteobacteria bacterium]MDH5734652.1 ABC transporter substrate-binding protein [Gammaproteobacteria bacterium]